jgi:O-antigen/teichoic acid export membrane protein
LVGVYITLLTLTTLLDLGLSTTLNRELARLSAHEGNEQEERDLVRTVEVVYWAVAVAVGLVVFLLVPFIAGHWVHAQHLSPQTIRGTLYAIGIVLALQFPFAMYSGGLLGLQRQVQLNLLVVIMGTVQGLGVVAVLWLISPTIEAYFTWQIVTTVLLTISSALLLWRALPRSRMRPRFRRQILLRITHFAGGMAGVAVLGVVATQLDKVMLSNRLTLTDFGYYSLAGAVAIGLYNLASPLYSAVFPQFSRLVALGDEGATKALYHRSSQLLSVIVLSAALVLAVFSPEVLLVWTRNPSLVQHTHLLLTLLAIGWGFNILISLPNVLMYANGWTRLSLSTNVITVALLGPALWLAIGWKGAVGAACVWIALNASYVFIEVQFMHLRLLKREKWRWYFQDIGVPLVGALSVTLLGRLLIPHNAGFLVTVAWLVGIAGLTVTVSALITPSTRRWILGTIGALPARYRRDRVGASAGRP